MTKELLYRTGTTTDFKQIKDLTIASYSGYSKILTSQNWATLNDFLHDEKKLLELLTKSQSFVCLVDNVIVGMAYLMLSGNPTDIFQEDWCYIRMVGVHPHYVGQGIGKRLTNMCIEKAKEMNEKTIALHTSEFMNAARHLYESLGFKVVREISPRLGKRYWLYNLALS
ncbi:MAG: putative acetyltransferase, family [Segetibacter sp.]|nr:putative acetyltransferase, family [Segetibacter sp.]